MDIKKIAIDYRHESNQFNIELNDAVFQFSPQQYMDFINQSIIAMNSVIAERFSSSLQSFLNNKKPKKTFTKKDCSVIADEVEQYFKENTLGG